MLTSRSRAGRWAFAIVMLLGLAGPELHDAVGNAFLAARLRQALATVRGIGIGSLDVDVARHTLVLRHLTLSARDFHMAIGRLSLRQAAGLRGGGIGQVSAADAAVILDDVRIDIGAATRLTIPHLEVRDTPLSAGDLKAVLDPNQSASVEDRLAKLSAGELVAAEVRLSDVPKAGGGEPAAVIFHDVDVRDVSAGRIGALSVRQIVLAEAPGKPGTTLSAGPLAVTRFDLPFALMTATEPRSEASMALRPLVGSFSLDRAEIKAPEGGMTIGSLRSGPIRGRPPLSSFATMAALASKPDGARSDAERRHATRDAVDLAESFAIDHVEMRDFGLSLHEGDSLSATLRAFIIDGVEPGQVRLVAAEGFALSSQEANVSFDRLALGGYDQRRLLDALDRENLVPDAKALNPHLVQVMPILADASLRALRIDAMADDLKGNARQGTRNVVDVPAVDLAMTSGQDGVETVSGDARMLFDIAPDVVDPGLIDLRQAGFPHLDVTLDGAAYWSAETGRTTIKRIAFGAKDVGSLAVGGVFGHMPPAFFDIADQDAAAEAVQAIEVEELHLDLANAGLAAKVWALAAEKSGVSVPLLKAESKGQIQLALLQAFGNTPTATALSNAVSAFIDEPKTLSVAVKAPAGLTLKAIAQSGGGRALLDLLQIEAKANP